MLKIKKYHPKIKKTLKKYGNVIMGDIASFNWMDDPKRLLFSLAKYKFISNFVEKDHHVLEIGCSDGFCSQIVAEKVKKYNGIDISKEAIDSANLYVQNIRSNMTFEEMDVFDKEIVQKLGVYDIVFSLDVLEHIEKKKEEIFIQNIVKLLNKNGIILIGMPSLQSQIYASDLSKIGHINCKDASELKNFLKKYFQYIYIFGVNDEMVHTGFEKLRHYNIALCIKPKGN